MYSARHHPCSQNVIVSGGYDKVVRIWSKQSDGLHGKVMPLSLLFLFQLNWIDLTQGLKDIILWLRGASFWYLRLVIDDSWWWFMMIDDDWWWKLMMMMVMMMIDDDDADNDGDSDDDNDDFDDDDDWWCLWWWSVLIVLIYLSVTLGCFNTGIKRYHVLSYRSW